MDLHEVDCIQQKRILAFVNHFTSQTFDFLAKFGANCESRLIQVEDRINKIDAELHLLEAKLDSVPGAGSVKGNLKKIITFYPGLCNRNDILLLSSL